MPDNPAAKLARMRQPEVLKSDKYQPWCRGRGKDVWAMLTASMIGDLDTVKALAATEPALLTCEYEYHTPLYFAVRENQEAVVDFLLQKEVDPARNWQNVIEVARTRGHNELAARFEKLFKNRYNIQPGGIIIASLIKSFDKEGIKKLLNEQPHLLHAADKLGNQPIHWAALTRQLDLIDYFLEAGADINARRPDGAKPIDLTFGDYHYRGWYRDLPLQGLKRHDVVTGYLMARGAYCDISIAAKIGYYERVRDLLDEDPGLANRLPDYDGYYTGLPLRCAASAGHIEIVKLLLERGANPNEPEPGIAPHGASLHSAISGRHYEIIKLLLAHGANANGHVESSGNCYWMAKHTNAPEEICKLIASHGGAKNLDMIFYDDDVETFAAILHADPQIDFNDDMPYHRGCMELALKYQPDIIKRAVLSTDDADFARWLIERGIDVNRGNWVDRKPLHRYAETGNIELAEICLDAGADINAIDTEYSATPLAWAVRNGKTAMAEFLLSKGAKY
jgi:ankyrin repeat protein